MSLFLATCQGIGLAVAAGAFAGASGRRGTVGVLLAVPAAIGGGVLFAISLSNRDHPAWPGVPLGIIIALLAFGVVSAVVAVGVALPLHYPYGLATIGHLGLIYLDLLIFAVGFVLGLRAFMGQSTGAANST